MGNLLRKPSRKLAAELETRDQRILELEAQLQHQSANFSIFVITHTGKSFTLDVELSDTVKRVKRMINAKEDIPADQQRLFYAGRELEDADTLQSHKIGKHSTIYQTVFSYPEKMQIFVKTLTGKKIKLEVKPSDTARRVKKTIEEKKGIDLSDQILIYADRELENPDTLQSHNVQNNSKLDLAIWYLPQKMQIVLITLTGKKIPFNVTKCDSVAQLKAIIYAQEGIPVDQQRLIYRAKQLEEHRKLEYYKIEDDSIIHLVMRITGC